MKQEILQEQSLSEKLVKKGFWLYLFSFLIAPSGYIIKVLVSNSLSVADVGVLYSIIGLIAFLNVYNDLGLTESLQYFLPRYWVKKQYDYIKTSIFLSFLAQFSTAILISLFLRFGAPWLAEHYFQSPDSLLILKYFCLYFLGINFFQIIQTIFIAFQDTFSSQLIDFVRMWSIVFFSLFFFLIGKQDIVWYSFTWILGLFVGILVSWWLFSRHYKGLLFQGKIVYDRPMIKEYINYALWCFVGLNVGSLFGQLIQQMVIVILGPEPAGYYTNFLSLFNIYNVVVGPIMGLIFPLVSEFVVKKDESKLRSLYSLFYTYFSVLILVLISFFIVLGPEIALVLFGKKFIFSGSLLSFGAIFSLFVLFVAFNFSVLAGMGKIKERVRMFFISLIAVAFIGFVGIYLLGIYGAVLSFGVGYLILFLMSFRMLYFSTPFSLDGKFILKNALLTSILAFFMYMSKTYFFLIDDSMRFHNFMYLLMFGFVLFSLIFALNHRKFFALISEIKKMRPK